MELLYLIIIILLFVLAISDLIVGVSNDAVNFLNSAMGSKAAPFKIVMLVASAGVLVGTIFSGGMMEIARSGIFYPDKFSFSDIMIIFVAVMITDVILLDLFNTFGFPTSTSVSLVFELMGSSVAIAIIYLTQHETNVPITDYINAGKALAIISGIFISVIIAFTAGTIIQFITRFLFSFNYQVRLKYLGGLFGGFAITTIVYFILIKGARDAAFISSDSYEWIKENSVNMIVFCLAGATLLFYILNLFFKINILKIIVLTGTFALALSFAGNDLVNFIGVPLAGYDSYLTFINTPGADPDLLKMDSLNGAVKAPFLFLLISGIIMVITLYLSRKARTVIYTEVNLGRQESSEERFGSSALSRGLVKLTIALKDKFIILIPVSYRKSIEKQFTQVSGSGKDKHQPAFDLLRASVNLVVSSALIALGTSMKLPLSTTYVTFMVAMGTSLADGAWGRESAVYRITGVFSVIGGWFFTAISAFTLSALMAMTFYFTGFYAIFVMMGIAALIIYRSQRLHTRREIKKSETARLADSVNPDNLSEIANKSVISVLYHLKDTLNDLLNGLGKNNTGLLKSVKKKNEEMIKALKSLRRASVQTIKSIPENKFEPAYHYLILQEKIKEILHSTGNIADMAYNHVANQHKPLTEQQIEEIRNIASKTASLSDKVYDMESHASSFALAEVSQMAADIAATIELTRKNEVKRIINGNSGHRSSMLFMGILQEIVNLNFYLNYLFQNYSSSTLTPRERDSYSKGTNLPEPKIF